MTNTKKITILDCRELPSGQIEVCQNIETLNENEEVVDLLRSHRYVLETDQERPQEVLDYIDNHTETTIPL